MQANTRSDRLTKTKISEPQTTNDSENDKENALEDSYDDQKANTNETSEYDAEGPYQLTLKI